MSSHTDSSTRKGEENRADIGRVIIALGLLALLASFDDAKDTGLVAASPPAHIDAAQP